MTARRDYLNNSRPLDVWRRSDHPVALEAAKRVFLYIRKQLESTSSNGKRPAPSSKSDRPGSSSPPINLPSNRGGGRQKFDNHLTRVLWDLAISQYDHAGDLIPPENIPWISVNLSDQAALRNDSRYNKCHWKPPQLRAVIDLLFSLSLIQKSPFKHVRAEGYGDGESFTTRILGTALLWNLLSDVRPSMLARDTDENLLLLVRKEGKKRHLLEYQDADHHAVPELRSNLGKINQYLSDISITLPLTSEQKDAINHERVYKGKHPCDFEIPFGTRMHYARIFQDQFETCGRFYGPWFQNIPSEARPYLKLDHRPTSAKTQGLDIEYGNWGTSEIDFSSLHPVLLYAQEGHAIETDPYAIPGLDDPKERNALKLIFQLLINCKSLNQAKNSVRRNDKLGSEYVHLLEPLISFHQPISHRFFDNGQTGKQLQRIDSDIAEQVLLEMGKRGWPCLTIHDSFITWDTHETMLTMEMDRALSQRYPGFKPNLNLYKVKRSDGTKATKEGIFTYSNKDDSDNAETIVANL